jgi:hypothetical protein
MRPTLKGGKAAFLKVEVDKWALGGMLFMFFSERRKGKERKGKERKGKERKGKERKGKERKGRKRRWKGKGKENGRC